MSINDPKYDFRDGRIFNVASGEVIPDDEPVFIFRARDKHAAAALHRYANEVSDEAHARAVIDRMREFIEFSAQHPDRMKEPDTEVGVKAKAWRPTHRHLVRGTEYEFLGLGRAQCSQSGLLDDEHVAIYRGEDGSLWARRLAEWTDGRFERINPAVNTQLLGDHPEFVERLRTGYAQVIEEQTEPFSPHHDKGGQFLKSGDVE